MNIKSTKNTDGKSEVLNSVAVGGESVGLADGTASTPRSPARQALVPGLKYRMRTECQADCDVARAVLGRWLCRWGESISVYEGRLLGPDMDVEFTTVRGAPELADLRWLLNSVTDLHVAAESLDYEDLYTGERVSYLEMEALMPSVQVVIEAREALERFATLLPLARDRLTDCQEALEARLGNCDAYLLRQVGRTATSLLQEQHRPALVECEADAYYLAMLSTLAGLRGSDVEPAEAVEWLQKLFPTQFPPRTSAGPARAVGATAKTRVKKKRN